MRITNPLSEEGRNYQVYLDGEAMDMAIAVDDELGQVVFLVKNPNCADGSAKFEGSELEQWLRKGAAILGCKAFRRGDTFNSFPGLIVLTITGKVELVYTGDDEEE